MKHIHPLFSVRGFLHWLFHPQKLLCWLYSAYLTIRFVDEYSSFPVFRFSKKIIRLNVIKGRNSKFSVNGVIKIEPWLSNLPSEIKLGENAELRIHNDLIIGDDVHVRLSKNASASFGGKNVESGSGITARSIILVKKELSIGKDVIIAWDTFITDSDWHYIGGIQKTEKTVICDHVWVANGAKILRGSIIGENSIVACGAVVTNSSFSAKSLIGGVPAKMIRLNIEDWHR